MVGLTIRNSGNVKDKVVGISLRRRDQLKPNVVWDELGKVIQSNARFGLTDRLEVRLDHVRMPAGNGTEKSKGRSLDVLSAVKKSIVVVKATFLCLAHALIIAIANDRNTRNTNRIGMVMELMDLLNNSRRLPGWIFLRAANLRNLNSFVVIFRTTKLLFMRD
jgi:hypothetical protein